MVLRQLVFLVLGWVGSGLAVEPCCPVPFQHVADTKEFASAHPLKAANKPYQSKGYIVRLSDFGSEDLAYLAVPDQPPLGGIVLIHEWWGLNDYIKEEADKLAALGYEVVAVDLYNGKVATDPEEAKKLMQGLYAPSALKTIQAGVRFLKESPKFKVNKVVTWGWCMGGGFSLQAALQLKGVDGAIMYYGPVELDRKLVDRLAVPLCGIFALQDAWVTATSVSEFSGLLSELGKENEIHSYDAAHAFANPSNAKFNATKAAEARAVVLAFLRRTVTEPSKKPNVIDRIEQIFK